MSLDNLLPRVFLHPIAPTRCVILNFVRMQFLGNKQERPWDQQRVKKSGQTKIAYHLFCWSGTVKKKKDENRKQLNLLFQR